MQLEYFPISSIYIAVEVIEPSISSLSICIQRIRSPLICSTAVMRLPSICFRRNMHNELGSLGKSWIGLHI